MKNQYFADRRDLLKYELLLDLVDLRPVTPRLTFIPMLTQDDETKEGNVTAYDLGKRRSQLFTFLRAALSAQNRELRRLRSYMREAGIEYHPYCDDAFFRHEDRTEYFAGVPLEALSAGVIFFDPDIGLETGSRAYMRRKGIEKYLFYEDVLRVAERAANDCIFVLYQHLQNDKTKVIADLAKRCRRLAAALDLSSIGYTMDRDVAFLAFSKDAILHGLTLSSLEKHSSIHGLNFGVLAN